MRKTLAVVPAALVLTGTALLTTAPLASADTGDSQVTANGTYQVVDADGNRGPVLHGRHTYTMGNGEGVRMLSGSCKSVDADGAVWGPLWVRAGRSSVGCYGANWGQ